MAETTYEEATRCPKCGRPGDVKSKAPAKNMPRGTQVHTVYCKTELCKWYNTCWLVQVNPDGSVPPATDHRGETKVYQGFEEHDQMARDIQAALMVQRELEIKGNGEIRNPHG